MKPNIRIADLDAQQYDDAVERCYLWADLVADGLLCVAVGIMLYWIFV